MALRLRDGQIVMFPQDAELADVCSRFAAACSESTKSSRAGDLVEAQTGCRPGLCADAYCFAEGRLKGTSPTSSTTPTGNLPTGCVPHRRWHRAWQLQHPQHRQGGIAGSVKWVLLRQRHCLFRQRMMRVCGRYLGTKTHLQNDAFTSKTSTSCGRSNEQLGSSKVFLSVLIVAGSSTATATLPGASCWCGSTEERLAEKSPWGFGSRPSTSISTRSRMRLARARRC